MRAISIDKNTSTLKKRVESRSSTIENWARKSILNWLSNISIGYLKLEEYGEIYEFGDDSSHLQAHVVIQSSETYTDIVFNGLVGAGESYIRGSWVSSDLVSVVRVLCANMSVMQSVNNSVLSSINQCLASLVHRFWKNNSHNNSRLNIAAHYDLGNDFFELFLDKSMMYSSAIFPQDDMSLDAAAEYKLEHICQRLQLKSTDHLLEIGTGWGGMAIHAAKNYGCRVTTTTISREQYEYATEQVREAGLQDKITLLLDDYRDLKTEAGGSFDKLVSIEMIEAVGHRYYQQYFDACSRLLKPEGLMLIQAITVPDQRYSITKNSTDFIQRYIFPGGELPCVSVIADHVTTDTNMQIVGIEDITLDYAKTLEAWRCAFLKHIDTVKSQGFDDMFIRLWDFYLAYCEGGFRERTIGTVQMLMAKPRCKQLPITSHS